MKHNIQTLSANRRKQSRCLNEETRSALEHFRLDRGLTYRKLGTLIGISDTTLFRGINGKGLHDTVIFKIQRFLEGLHAR